MRSLSRIVLVAVLVLGLGGAVSAADSRPSLQPFDALRWRLIGPFRGGRTVAVSGVPQQPGVFYMAPNNGGVWKSIDDGHTWNPIFDGNDTGSVGALAVAPSDPNVVYVGSGEGLRRPDLSTGDGMYRSTDAGATWTHQGLRDGQQIQAIAVDPRDAKRLYVAVVGHPFGANAERGLYRSTDGGATYAKVLGGNDPDVGAVSVTIDPNHPDVVYAALWASRNGPWNLVQVYERYDAGGLFKSVDGGTTWTKLAGGLPARAGRIGITVSLADSARLYATVEKEDGCGIFRSDDAGVSWKQTDSEERVCGRTEDFAGITADPHDRDTVYAADTTTYRSIDGGTTWTGIKGAPGGDDYHTVWIDPANPAIIILGVDQGATISVDHGATWSTWYNQPTAQFYHVITDDRFPYRVFGAQQESGSAEVVSRGNDGAITFREFHPVGAEEYAYIAPDPLHPWLIYGGTSVYDERTGQTRDIAPTYDRKTYRFDRTNPLVWNRVDHRTLYFGLNVLFATTNGGTSWKIISPDLTRTNPGEPATLAHFASGDPRNGKHRGVIYSLAPSYRDAKLIWAGTDDGYVWITRDAGSHWKNVTPPALGPWDRVTQIGVRVGQPSAAGRSPPLSVPYARLRRDLARHHRRPPADRAGQYGAGRPGAARLALLRDGENGVRVAGRRCILVLAAAQFAGDVDPRSGRARRRHRRRHARPLVLDPRRYHAAAPADGFRAGDATLRTAAYVSRAPRYQHGYAASARRAGRPESARRRDHRLYACSERIRSALDRDCRRERPHRPDLFQHGCGGADRSRDHGAHLLGAHADGAVDKRGRSPVRVGSPCDRAARRRS
jgi:photosystem II stability/assembly factor-like uncharacterized protein